MRRILLQTHLATAARRSGLFRCMRASRARGNVEEKEATMAKKTIAEQISALEATRQAKAARMTELMEAAAEKGAPRHGRSSAAESAPDFNSFARAATTRAGRKKM